MLMQRRPGAKVVPPEIGWQAEDISLLLSLRRARLQHAVIHADVFTLGIDPAESARELARAIGLGNFLQQLRGFPQMLAQRIRQRLRAPQKHPAIPEIIS